MIDLVRLRHRFLESVTLWRIACGEKDGLTQRNVELPLRRVLAI